MNLIVEDVCRAIERDHPELEDWTHERRIDHFGSDTVKALRWVAFELSEEHTLVALKTIGVREDDLEPLRRILQSRFVI